MSILKFIDGKNRGKGALRQAINYILNPEKMPGNFILGNGINLDTPYEDMETVQALFGKNTGRRYIHYILSFDEDVSGEMALEVAEEAASYFADEFQYVLAIHTNKRNNHAHVVVSTINIRTGNKFSQSKAEMLEFRNHVNDCLAKHGLNLIGESEETEICCKTGELEEWEDDEEILEDDETESYCSSYSFFGFVDPEEISQIQCAQLKDEHMHEIIRFFEGEAEELPPNTYYEDAKIQYLLWKDSQRWFEDTDKNNFFENRKQ